MKAVITANLDFEDAVWVEDEANKLGVNISRFMSNLVKKARDDV